MVQPRTPNNRGFTWQRGRRLVNPVVARPYAGGRTLPGAPLIQRTKKVPKGQPYPNPPPTWTASVGEWVVYWYLTRVKKYVEKQDFYYQSPVFAPYLFSSRDFTRVDFLIDFGPQSQAAPIGDYKALCFDPITAFTHPDMRLDKEKRRELADAGYLLIFLETTDLLLRPRELIEAGLVGRDLSSRR